MSREAPIKSEKDFTDILDKELPEISKISENDYKQGLEKLLSLEKQTRQSLDLPSSKRLMISIVDLLVSNKDWQLLNEQMLLLSKKHGQLKASVQTMIESIVSELDQIKEEETKIEVIETIRTITENKIYVEIERARVTKIYSDILLKNGDLDKATEILCELQVETYGSMELEEKIRFILDQMILCNRKGDYVFSKILSRKVLVRTLEQFPDHKLQYYKLMTAIALNDDDYLNIVKYNLSILEIPKIKEDPIESLNTLKTISYFIVLSPFDNLQNDLINKITNEKLLDKLTLEKSLIKSFTLEELIKWDLFETNFSKTLFNTDFFNQSNEKGIKHWKDLQKRAIEHNLRIISKYYSTITLDRLTELLQLTQSEVETNITKLVNEGIIFAKINRPLRVVSFVAHKSENELLNDWSNNINELLDNIETIEHLINKEEMMYGVRAK
ncbi:unnamed protein product [[Candida] boidinii]|nr:unnamed protein product [[Candida] boidinii]